MFLVRVPTALGCLPILMGVSTMAGFAEDPVSGANCTFQKSPDQFVSAQSRARGQVFERGRTYSFARGPVDMPSPETIPRRNFIDDEVFGRMAAAQVKPAPLAGDEEFLRRVTLDLTGRLPSPPAIRAFIADAEPGKRERLIDHLLASAEFIDKWTMWMGDWLRNSATNSTSSSPQQLAGRNAFYSYIRNRVEDGKSLREVAFDIVSASGNNFDEPTGQVNFISSSGTPGGPRQDTYDTMLVKSTTVFLGLGHYDCLLCHNGRGHLNELSLWGTNITRLEAQKMAAFFARTNLVRWRAPAGTPAADARQMPYNRSFTVEDVTSRTYDLNTNYGNRPSRRYGDLVLRLTPEYRGTGQPPGGENWRTWFAALILDDPMFATNIVNRLWKQMFNLALVEPVDGLDPARLDTKNPPPEPWTFQATHPELLERLAAEFIAKGYDLRTLLRLIVSSSAYQLSSRYDGEWKPEYVPLFARRYPRRLDGEEVHDAICSATGVFNEYTQFNRGTPVKWAMQLLDPMEPRNSRGASVFLNYFLRGDRDTQPRSQAVSIEQALALMNDRFVVSRIRMNASPVLQDVAKLPANEGIVEELFLTFLTRRPSDFERTQALGYLATAATDIRKQAIIEDLAWSLINKLEFLFSY